MTYFRLIAPVAIIWASAGLYAAVNGGEVPTWIRLAQWITTALAGVGVGMLYRLRKARGLRSGSPQGRNDP